MSGSQKARDLMGDETEMGWFELRVKVALPVDEDGMPPEFDEGGDPMTGITPWAEGLAGLLKKAFSVDELYMQQVSMVPVSDAKGRRRLFRKRR